MTNKELFKAICNEACHCDMMIGYTCIFCKELKSRLEKALGGGCKPTRRSWGPWECGKHPRYKAIKYPTSECAWCLHMWNFKQGARRWSDEVDRKYLERLRDPNYGKLKDD